MVKPAARREAVTFFREAYGLSQVRACGLASLQRSTYGYRSQVTAEVQALRQRLRDAGSIVLLVASLGLSLVIENFCRPLLVNPAQRSHQHRHIHRQASAQLAVDKVFVGQIIGGKGLGRENIVPGQPRVIRKDRVDSHTSAVLAKGA